MVIRQFHEGEINIIELKKQYNTNGWFERPAPLSYYTKSRVLKSIFKRNVADFKIKTNIVVPIRPRINKLYNTTAKSVIE